MSKSNFHMVSRLRWQTSFDKKEKAVECQNRLSNWSRDIMPAQADSVFDGICSDGEYLQVERLELDLGVISYQSLETELTERVIRQLREKLAGMFGYSGLQEKPTDARMLTAGSSALELIAAFLLHGSMPWNYKSQLGSFNELLSQQLLSHFAETISALRSVGITHENARQRLAWQADEENMTRIVRGLEPGSHTYIIGFANTLTRLQAKKAVVKTGAKEFRKNVWFWILNYLLAEQGSVFNRVSFVKSNLRQMAARYNMDYRELMQLIETAVHEMVQRQADKTELISILKLLISKNGSFAIEKEKNTSSQSGRWQQLQQYLKEPAQQRLNKKEFNALVASAVKHEPDKIREQLYEPAAGWEKATRCLTGDSLKKILSALQITQENVSVEELSFLTVACSSSKVAGGIKDLWKIALCLLADTTHSNTGNDFLKEYTRLVSKQARISEAELISRLLAASLPSSAKTISALQVRQKLLALYKAKELREGADSLHNYFTRLITVFYRQVHPEGTGHRRKLVQEQIINLMKYHPAAAYEILSSYPDKKKLAAVLPQLLSGKAISGFVKHIEKEHGKVVLSLQKRVSDILFVSRSSFAVQLNSAIAFCGMQISLLYPNITGSLFREMLLTELSEKMPVNEYRLLVRTIKQAASISSGPAMKSDADFEDTLSASLSFFKHRFPHSKYSSAGFAAKYVEMFSGNLSSLCNTLQDYRNTQLFAQVTAPDSAAGNRLLQRITCISYREKNELLHQLSGSLSHYVTSLSENRLLMQMHKIYWGCALMYSVHKGDRKRFAKFFLQSVVAAYKIQQTESVVISESVPASFTRLMPVSISRLFASVKTGDGRQLLSGKKITQKKLLTVLDQCLAKATAVIIIDGERYSLKELINAAIESSEAGVRAVIRKHPLTDKRIDLLTNILPFHKLAAMVPLNGSLANQKAMVAIKKLYGLVRLQIPSANAAQLVNEYHKQVLFMVKEGTFSTARMEGLINRSLHCLIHDTRIKPALFLPGIKAAGFRLEAKLEQEVKKITSPPNNLEININETPDGLPSSIAREPEQVAEIIRNLIRYRKVPYWLSLSLSGNMGEQKTKRFFAKLVKRYPDIFLSVLKAYAISEPEMQWIHESVGFAGFVKAVTDISPSRKTESNWLVTFYQTIGNLQWRCLPSYKLQSLFFKKIVERWQENKTRLISSRYAWQELLWDAADEYGVDENDFIADLQKDRHRMPRRWQTSLSLLSRTGKKKTETTMIQEIKAKPAPKIPVLIPGQSLPVKNAGLVLVSSYIPLLFSRLEFEEPLKKKREADRQSDAVHYLQYIATGLCCTEEHFLLLNKLLCGMPLQQPVHAEVAIPEAHKTVIDGMLKACINHWPAIGECTLNGFRGNWLVRDGLLTEKDDRWELTVEKRSYDILINRSPFSFSLIHYPWMDKPLHVTWPY